MTKEMLDDLVVELPEPPAPAPPPPTEAQRIAGLWLGQRVYFPLRERVGRTTAYRVAAWVPGEVIEARAIFGRVDLVVRPEGGEGEWKVSAAGVRHTL